MVIVYYYWRAGKDIEYFEAVMEKGMKDVNMRRRTVVDTASRYTT